MEKISEDSFGISPTQGFFIAAYASALSVVGLPYTNLLFLSDFGIINAYSELFGRGGDISPAVQQYHNRKAEEEAG